MICAGDGYAGFGKFLATPLSTPPETTVFLFGSGNGLTLGVISGATSISSTFLGCLTVIAELPPGFESVRVGLPVSGAS